MEEHNAKSTLINRLGFVTSLFGLVPIGLTLSIAALMEIDQAKGKIGGKKLAFVSVALNLIWISVFCFVGLVVVPAFKEQKLKVKAVEAHVFLTGLSKAQESFKDQFGSYAPLRPTPKNPSQGEQQIWDSKPCPKDCRPGNTVACTEFSCLDYRPLVETVLFQYGCKRGPSGLELSCGALADLDQDGIFETLTFRKAGPGVQTSTLADGLSTCESEVAYPVNEVIRCPRKPL